VYYPEHLNRTEKSNLSIRRRYKR